MELNLLLTLDLREQAALQSALVTHGAPDALVTLALTGACRIGYDDQNGVVTANNLIERRRGYGRVESSTNFKITQRLVRVGVCRDERKPRLITSKLNGAASIGQFDFVHQLVTDRSRS